MAFQNARSILKLGSPLSTFKLLVITAASSRPQFRGICNLLLRPFIHDGEVLLRYRCYDRYRQCYLRLGEVSSDLLSVLELCARDTYDLDIGFKPDLVIDGGGNIGLFTLRASAAAESTHTAPVTFVICEPMPVNLEQLRRHLRLNSIQAEIVEGCLGGEHRTVPFYCREPINSSFDPDKPYLSVLEMPVFTLAEVIGYHPAKRILVKLDIEGAEIEVLQRFVPAEQRPTYIVGELHHFSLTEKILESIFHDHGWSFEFLKISGEDATFRACSPAAVPLLGWASAVLPAPAMAGG